MSTKDSAHLGLVEYARSIAEPATDGFLVTHFVTDTPARLANARLFSEGRRLILALCDEIEKLRSERDAHWRRRTLRSAGVKT